MLGSAISLAYYLRVVAAIWAGRRGDRVPRAHARRPAGHRRRPPTARHPLAVGVALVCLVAVIAFGIYPQPMFDAAQDAGAALKSLV